VRAAEVISGHQSKLQWWSKELLENEIFKDTDLVHLQIVHDHFLRFETIKEIASRKPTVWTWHDLWPVTGHCIFPIGCGEWAKGCGNCPDLLSPLPVFRDRTAAEYARKSRMLENLDIDVHVTTQWMLDRISPHITNTKLKVHVFPFGIDLDLFKPIEPSLIRRKLGIADDTFCVFARATDDPRKGFKELVRALDELSHHADIMLITTQATGLAGAISENLRIIEMPWTNSPTNLIALYNACDVFAMPSTGESFGMMALEAMACGKPVITIKGTATSEVVSLPELEVDAENLTENLKSKLNFLVEHPETTKELGRVSRVRAQEKFSLETYLKNLVNLYRSVIAGRK
jgi:glycosyltransferase involved in cell wall biosynthesis